MNSTSEYFSSLRSAHKTPPARAVKRGALAYYRVSTIDQLENFSIETQKKRCRQFCEQKGFSIIAEFEEAASAKTAVRPELQKMLALCRARHKDIGAVVVYVVSRFSRDSADFQVLRLALSKQNIKLLFADQNFDDSPTGRFSETMASAQAQLENEQKSELTKQGMVTALGSGKWVHKAPIGYVNGDIPGGLALDPLRAPLVKRAFELYASGQHTKIAVLAIVTTEGLRMPKTGKTLSAQSFDKMLRRPSYAGWIAANSWGIIQRGLWEPIISEELFERAQVVISGKCRNGSQSKSLHSEDFPLRVFVRCAVCGKGLTGSFATGRQGKRYAHYFCRTPRCRAVKFRRDDLHRLFYELLYGFTPQEAFMPLFHELLVRAWREKNREREESTVRAQKKLQELDAEKSRLLKLVIDEIISPADYKDQEQRVGTERRALQNQVLLVSVTETELDALVEFAEWLLGRVAGIWASATLANKHRLQATLFPDGITVSQEGFGPAHHPLFFEGCGRVAEREASLASPGGFEPPLPP